MRLMLLAPLAAASLAAGFGVAFAQETAVAPNSWLAPAWQIIQPVVTVLLSVLVPVVVALLVELFRRLLKLVGSNDAVANAEAEKCFREALHDAAFNALKYAVARRTGPIGDMITGAVPPDILNEAIDYVRSKNPDAAEKLDDKNLVEIILSKVPDVQAIIAAGQGKPAAAIDVTPIGS